MSYSVNDYEVEDEARDLPDWAWPVAFNHKRHTENIVGGQAVTQTWRMKERMRTVSVALVVCLNVGVDPPDIIKTQPCARLECWFDPFTLAPTKSLETIGNNLQKQYERWQPRARYKQSLDPTVDEVKKLCTSLRKNAKDERVLFHYNGHGVPKPTANGEIWVFNRTYTQYIPLSIYDLQQWMGEPSIYVYDCSCAGLILESFNQFAIQHEREYELAVANSKGQYQGPSLPSYKNCIQLAACGPQQILPMNPDLPADLFTSCLTTPIKIALKWFVLQNTCKLVPGITLDILEKIPGQLNDRRTMLGELNWLFTAITDTIAWNVLPKDLFQRLFRQDLLVASLFRNFLLAERVMRSYNCNPVSSPPLPSTHHHPMWNAWDLAVDMCLSQLPHILEEGAPFRHSSFFAEQLTAFQVWLSYSSDKHGTPEQLPIVLQVLLSQVHRLRALELLGRFLDLGPWAVNLALSVGIFPYVLKLLQSSARELRPLLAFVWAKVIAVDNTCQADLVRDGGHKYFLNILADPYIPGEHRTMAAFVMSCIVHNYPPGQEAALQGNLIAICLEQINDPNPLLRQWLAICLGQTWCNFDSARWCGVRDSAHEKLYTLLSDPVPEVRAAAVYALGTFINSTTERTDHANTIDHTVGITLINAVLYDCSPIVRKELVVALQWLVLVFENQFVAVARQFVEEEKVQSGNASLVCSQEAPSAGPLQKVASRDRLKMLTSPFSAVNPALSLDLLSHVDGRLSTPAGMRRVNSSTSLSSLNVSVGLTSGYASAYTNIWRALLTLCNDPHPDVAAMANTSISTIKNKVQTILGSTDIAKDGKPSSSSYSEPSSPSGKPGFIAGESPPVGNLHSGDAQNTAGVSRWPDSRQMFQQYQYSAQFTRSRKLFDKGPSVVVEDTEEQNKPKQPLVSTDFIDWCCRYFSQPIIKFPEDMESDSPIYQEREWKFMRNANIRKGVEEEKKRLGKGKLDEQVFINKNPNIPSVIIFHPYESHLVVTDKDSYSVWDWEQGAMLSYNSNGNLPNTRITSVDFINAHDSALLMLGSDEGAVRIWRNYINDNNKPTQLVTAFQALSDMAPSTRGSGLVLQWEQLSCRLLVSGDVRIIRLWDTEKEMKIQDIPTGADSCVTKLSTEESLQSVLVAGCGDGTIRIYDCRLPPNDCRVTTLREHSGWVVNVHLYQQDSESKTCGKIVSGSVAGDLKFWDLRCTSSLRSVQTSNGTTAMAVHPAVGLVACGSVNQFISMYNMNGETLSIIKYHDGFMGHRIGPISCLAFHPYKASLAAGSTDSFISIYSMDRKH